MEAALIGLIIGAIVGFGMWALMGAGSSTRDVRIIPAPMDAVLPDAQQWAQRYGYTPVAPEGSGVEFQKGTGFLVAATRLRLEAVPAGTQVSTWIRLGIGGRRTMALARKGFTASVPRDRAINEVNHFLSRWQIPVLVKG